MPSQALQSSLLLLLFSKCWKIPPKQLNIKKPLRKKRAERDQQLKQISVPPINISESLREKILNSDATTLIEMLKSSQVTSEQILITYFQRANTRRLEYELITKIAFKEANGKDFCWYTLEVKLNYKFSSSQSSISVLFHSIKQISFVLFILEIKVFDYDRLYSMLFIWSLHNVIGKKKQVSRGPRIIKLMFS